MRKRYLHPEKEAVTKASVYVDLFLTKGVKFQFAKLPANDYTAVLLDRLKRNGFVSKDTRLCHFRVLFGIPLQENETQFVPIKWLKNKQLLHYFVKYLFGDKWYRFKDLFADKNGNPVIFPHPDKKRLYMSADYDMLKKMVRGWTAGEKAVILRVLGFCHEYILNLLMDTIRYRRSLYDIYYLIEHEKIMHKAVKEYFKSHF